MDGAVKQGVPTPDDASGTGEETWIDGYRFDTSTWALVADDDDLRVLSIAMALADQTDYEHRWLVDPRTGEVVFWTSDTGIDGENPVDLDELDLIVIDPVPSYVWYRDMVDFAEGISDRAAGRSLSRALEGKGAFRRFRNELYERHPVVISVWQSFRDARARARAVGWLAEQGLVGEEVARQFTTGPSGAGPAVIHCT